MNTRNAIRIVSSATGAAIVAFAALSCSDQPRVRCSAARGNFAATYRLVSGTGACAGLKGDVLAVQTYNGSNPDKTPNWDQASMGIQAQAITGLLQTAGGAMVSDPNTEDLPYSLGSFSTAEPGSDDFCVVPTLSATRLRLPEIPPGMDGMGGMTPGQPATDVAYTWSNVRVYVTAAANGTEFSASLTVVQDGCTAEYAVEGLYPAVSCLVPPPMIPPPEMPSDDAGVADEASVMTDDAGSDSSAGDDAATGADDASAPDVEMPPAPAPTVDETLCSPQADPAAGRPLGSGISPDIVTRCDPDLQLCVLAKAPPSLR